MTEAPEPKDKLDAATIVVVNGPEDAPFDWRQIDWRRVEDEVRRLRQRIFTASKAGDLARVRSLQKLMLRSRANTLLSVRRVTERNAGRLTAGVDGEVVLTPEAKARLADRIQHRDRAVQGHAGQAGVHPQAGQQHQAPTIRDSRDRRSVPSGTGRQCAGARVGGAGSSRGPTGSGPAVAAMTRSKRSIHVVKGKPEAAVGAGRRFGRGVRQDRPRPHLGHARHVPRPGDDPRSG